MKKISYRAKEHKAIARIATMSKLFFNSNSIVMKKFFICTMFLLMTTSSFSQQTDLSQSLTRQDYLKKSKNQKTAAWILLGGGVALAVGAPILTISSATWFQSDASWEIAFVTGCASVLGSIPLFIAAKRNKRKAMKVSTYFEIQRNPVLTNTGIALHSTPTLSLKLNF